MEHKTAWIFAKEKESSLRQIQGNLQETRDGLLQTLGNTTILYPWHRVWSVGTYTDQDAKLDS